MRYTDLYECSWYIAILCLSIYYRFAMFPIVVVCFQKVLLYGFVTVYMCGPDVFRLHVLMLASSCLMFSKFCRSPPNGFCVCFKSVPPRVSMCP
jgi:hypothetical protein